jgi:hypothetical protein
VGSGLIYSVSVDDGGVDWTADHHALVEHGANARDNVLGAGPGAEPYRSAYEWWWARLLELRAIGSTHP